MLSVVDPYQRLPFVVELPDDCKRLLARELREQVRAFPAADEGRRNQSVLYGAR